MHSPQHCPLPTSYWWTHLLLLTGDREYGDTSLPSSGLERLVLREYCRWGTPLSGCCAPKPWRPEPLAGKHTGCQTRSALTGDACPQQTRPGPRGVLPQACWCPPTSPAPTATSPSTQGQGRPKPSLLTLPWGSHVKGVVGGLQRAWPEAGVKGPPASGTPAPAGPCRRRQRPAGSP